jgi:hypothetical protein
VASLALPACALAQDMTKTTLAIAPNPGVAGALATYTATVAADPPAGLMTPTGTVSFSTQNGTAIGGPVWLDAGEARMTVLGGAGVWPVQARYSGDPDFASSTGMAVHTINRADTIVTLTAAPNPATFGQDIRFAVRVNSLPPSTWQPDGSLSFTFAGTPVLSPVFVQGGGELSLVTQIPVVGSFAIGAHYAGATNFNASEAIVPMTVLPTPTPSPTATPLPAPRRLAARRLSVAVAPRRDRRPPYRFSVNGTLVRPAATSAATGCTGGVTVRARSATKRLVRRAKLDRTCRWSVTVSSRDKGKIAITASFDGNDAIEPITARTVRVRAG